MVVQECLFYGVDTKRTQLVWIIQSLYRGPCGKISSVKKYSLEGQPDDEVEKNRSFEVKNKTNQTHTRFRPFFITAQSLMGY